jgi:hypothetical protein
LNAVVASEMEAGMSTARPLRDNARLEDFQDAHPKTGVGPIFYRWCTLNQCTPRHVMKLELEARGQDVEVSASGQRQQRGHTFHPSTMGADDDEDAMTFHPSPGMRSHTYRPGETMADAPAADPLTRQAYPLVDQEDDFDEDDSTYPDVNDGDVEHMRPSPSSSLRALQREGLIKRRMSPAQLSARLHRLGFPEPARHRRLAAAQLAGFHAAAGVPAYTPPSSAQGDTLRERTEDAPQRGHLPPGRVANLHASGEDPDRVRRELRHVDWDRMCPWRTSAPKGLTLRGHAETRCG